jgi:hypothetical protein
MKLRLNSSSGSTDGSPEVKHHRREHHEQNSDNHDPRRRTETQARWGYSGHVNLRPKHTTAADDLSSPAPFLHDESDSPYRGDVRRRISIDRNHIRDESGGHASNTVVHVQDTRVH